MARAAATGATKQLGSCQCYHLCCWLEMAAGYTPACCLQGMAQQDHWQFVTKGAHADMRRQAPLESQHVRTADRNARWPHRAHVQRHVWWLG